MNCLPTDAKTDLYSGTWKFFIATYNCVLRSGISTRVSDVDAFKTTQNGSKGSNGPKLPPYTNLSMFGRTSLPTFGNVSLRQDHQRLYSCSSIKVLKKDSLETSGKTSQPSSDRALQSSTTRLCLGRTLFAAHENIIRCSLAQLASFVIIVSPTISSYSHPLNSDVRGHSPFFQQQESYPLYHVAANFGASGVNSSTATAMQNSHNEYRIIAYLSSIRSLKFSPQKTEGLSVLSTVSL